MNDKELNPSDKLIFDTFLQNIALQNLLILKGLITKEEIFESIKETNKSFLKPFLEKVGVSSDAADSILENILTIK